MEERDRHQHGFLAFFAVDHPVADLQGIGDQVAVQSHCAFGNAGCAAAVLEQSHIIWSDSTFGRSSGLWR